MSKLIRDIKSDFSKDTKNHSMQVTKDDGVHRHIDFNDNGSAIHGFSLTTWPGYLCISGDCGCYVFSRDEDMFAFFKKSKRVSAHYWGEKLVSTRSEGYKEFSQEKFRDCIEDDFGLWEFMLDESKGAAWERMQVELDDVDLSNETRAMDWIDNYESNSGHKFVDFFEHNLSEYTNNYIWCLHAIVYGIKTYDKWVEDKANAKAVAKAEQSLSKGKWLDGRRVIGVDPAIGFATDSFTSPSTLDVHAYALTGLVRESKKDEFPFDRATKKEHSILGRPFLVKMAVDIEQSQRDGYAEREADVDYIAKTFLGLFSAVAIELGLTVAEFKDSVIKSAPRHAMLFGELLKELKTKRKAGGES